MSINQRLDLRQGQTLTMTPQLQQAIKLLQMSNIELAAFIEAEIEKNPLLEKDDSLNAATGDTDAAPHDANVITAPQQEPDPTAPRADDDRDMAANYEDVFTGDSITDQQMAAHDGGYDAFATSAFADVGKGGGMDFDDPSFSFENTMAEKKTLRDHLVEQIQVEFKDPLDRAVAAILLDYLDRSGYLRVDVAQLAERLGGTEERVTTTLAQLQELDPPGIFARDLRECLAIQLRQKNRLDPAMQALLDNLDVLAAHDMKKLRTLCGVDDDDLKDMIAEIRALDPKPATAFDHFVAQTVVPDVLMRPLPKSKGGGWTVELNNDTLPRVLMNKTYHAEIIRGAVSKKDKEYINEQANAANWLIRAMEQRAETILKTAAEIIVQQENFFVYGVEYLKPLGLKDVAAAVGMHESTISRVTTGKYIGTPRGVFELKYFFTSGVSSTDGGAAFSSEAIKARIRTLIDAEDPQKILSDDDLVTTLRADGIDIARRTVAKYREAMKIPSSVQRRRLKNSRA